jgi:hypothetical protein
VSSQKTTTLKKNSFIPKPLRKKPVQPGFSNISQNIYKSANILLKIAQQENRTYSFHVHSSVILFTTTLECYFNETLTLNLLAKKYHSKEVLESLRQGNNMSFHEKIRNVFLIYDKTQKGIDTDGDIYRDLVALGSLRNKIVHYNPEWENMYEYPKDLEHILSRTQLELENAGWITNFSNLIVGQWAKTTVKNTLIEFSRITGAFNPFTEEDSFKALKWED